MSSVFLMNAVLLFAGVIAFVVAGFAGAFVRRLQPWRYRILLTPLGFVVTGGIGISAEAHLLRWIEHGHAQPTLLAGLLQSCVLLLAGCAGMLAGVGLGTTLDRVFAEHPSESAGSLWPQRSAAAATRADATSKRVVSIAEARRRPVPGALPKVKASSQSE